MINFLIQIKTVYFTYTTANIRALLGAAVIVLFFLLLRKLFTRYLFGFILNLGSHSKFEFNDKLLLAFEKPLRAFFPALGVFLALRYLPLSPAADILINKFFRSFFILIVVWGIYELSGNNSFFSDEMKEKLKIDSILIPWFSKLARFIIIALAVVLIAHEWNFDVNGFVAGLGLGGLAFALAAKDVLANIFGGMVIIMEKPFSIGDTVSTPSVEGTVEDISFRSTRFRNTSQALVTVPNSTLANEPISNLSRMEKRRVSFYLGLNKNSSADQIEISVKRIYELLKSRSDIYGENITVTFENFKESSFDILITYFTKATDFTEHLKVKEDINFQIMRVLNEEDTLLASYGQAPYAPVTPNK